MSPTTMQQRKERPIDLTSRVAYPLLTPAKSPPRRLRWTAAVGVVIALVVVSLVVIASPSQANLEREKVRKGDDQAAPSSPHRRGLMNDLSLSQFSDPKNTVTVSRQVVQQLVQQVAQEQNAQPQVVQAHNEHPQVGPEKHPQPQGEQDQNPQTQNRCGFAHGAHLDMTVVNKAASRHHASKGNGSAIRYLTFGTSISWGAGMNSRFDAYPYVLSPCVKNLAMRASTSVYSALCAESRTDDDVTYDVVVLEFHQIGNDGLIHLARRMRQRFPDATLIFLRLWYPLQIWDFETKQNVKDWAEERGHMALHSPEFHAAVLESDTLWSWRDYRPAMKLQDEAAAEVGGFVLELPRPDEPKDFVKFAHYISHDWHHLSERGHEYVARNILQILQNNGGVVTEPRLGTWGSGDSCHSWFENGEFPYEHSPNMQMEQIDDAGTKHALNVPQEGGDITIVNPSEGMLDLYLTYMATGPAPIKYPRTEVTIVGSQEQEPVTIDPIAPDYGHWVHVALTKRVGRVNPGKSVVHLKPLEEKEFPFRLTATIVTGTSGVEGEVGSNTRLE